MNSGASVSSTSSSSSSSPSRASLSASRWGSGSLGEVPSSHLLLPLLSGGGPWFRSGAWSSHHTAAARPPPPAPMYSDSTESRMKLVATVPFFANALGVGCGV